MSRRIQDATQRAPARPAGRSAPLSDGLPRMLADARRAAGWNDFGDEGFLEGLRVLLRAYDEEAHLTPLGRTLVEGELTSVLRNRLLAERGWSEHPEALASEIRRPIFVLGLPRTGTTALHGLLQQDPAHQVLEFWLAAAPRPRPPRETWPDEPHYQEALRALEFTYSLDPELAAIHLLTADGAEECRHLLMQSFTDDTFDSNATIPSYTRWFAAQDMRPAYARHRDLLKLIGSTSPERRWVLKYPAHIRNLDVVLETYPDACFVQTHRDPRRVLPSLCSLVTRWRGIYEGKVDVEAEARHQLDMWATLMETGIRKRQALPEERFVDVHFRELLADPVGVVRKVYARFDTGPGAGLGAEAERRMREHHARNPQGRHGIHEYSAEQFGLSEGEIAERFAGYTEHFGVESEARD